VPQCPIAGDATAHNPDFKGTPSFDIEYLRNNTRQTHGYNSGLLNCAITNDRDRSSRSVQVSTVSKVQHVMYEVGRRILPCLNERNVVMLSAICQR